VNKPVVGSIDDIPSDFYADRPLVRIHIQIIQASSAGPFPCAVACDPATFPHPHPDGDGAQTASAAAPSPVLDSISDGAHPASAATHASSAPSRALLIGAWPFRRWRRPPFPSLDMVSGGGASRPARTASPTTMHAYLAVMDRSHAAPCSTLARGYLLLF